MKKYISIIGLLACLFTPVRASAQTPHGREHLSLNGEWKSLEESGRDGAALGWTKSLPIEAKPRAFPERSAHSSGAVWYWREATLPTGWTKLNVRLRLTGISGLISAWVNGRPAEIEIQGGSSITFDVTKQLMPNAANALSIRVAPTAPAKTSESKNSIGQAAEIELIASDEAHIESVEVQPAVQGWITVHVRMTNTSDKTGDAQLQAEVFDATQPKKRVAVSTISVVVSPGKNRADISMKLKPPKATEGESEVHYRATVTFRQNKDTLDNETVSFVVPLGARP